MEFIFSTSNSNPFFVGHSIYSRLFVRCDLIWVIKKRVDKCRIVFWEVNWELVNKNKIKIMSVCTKNPPLKILNSQSFFCHSMDPLLFITSDLIRMTKKQIDSLGFTVNLPWKYAENYFKINRHQTNPGQCITKSNSQKAGTLTSNQIHHESIRDKKTSGLLMASWLSQRINQKNC